MSLRIRLARGGAKKRPFYRIVVADSRSPRDGRFIDRLGHYHPLLPRDHAERVVLDVEKAKTWIAKGAQPTDRVLRFLDAAGVMKRPDRVNPTKAQPGKKALERAEARKQADDEAKAAAEAPAPAEETPAEEAAAEASAPAEETPAEEAAAEASAPAEETPAEEAAAEAPAPAEETTADEAAAETTAEAPTEPADDGEEEAAKEQAG